MGKKFSKEELALRTQLIIGLSNAHPQRDEYAIGSKAISLWRWIEKDIHPLLVEEPVDD